MKKGNLVIYCIYIRQGDEHEKIINELILKLLLLKKLYYMVILVLKEKIFK